MAQRNRCGCFRDRARLRRGTGPGLEVSGPNCSHRESPSRCVGRKDAPDDYRARRERRAAIVAIARRSGARIT